MRRAAFLAAAWLAAPAPAQTDGSLRADRPAMAAGATQRAGQPVTLAPPPAADPSAAARARFAAAYARARSPRIVVFWNREMTDDVETEHESYVRSSGDDHTRAASRRVDYATWGAGHSDVDAWADSHHEGEVRAGIRRLDPGRRDAPDAEAIDFDIERGFTGALQDAGARLVDRTAIVRAGALGGGDGDNMQAIETRAVLGRADMTLEVVPLDDPRADGGVSYKIVARDVASGRIVASLAGTGRAALRHMPYVAGEHGFVRATPPTPTALGKGRRLAEETMAALAARL